MIAAMFFPWKNVFSLQENTVHPWKGENTCQMRLSACGLFLALDQLPPPPPPLPKKGKENKVITSGNTTDQAGRLSVCLSVSK